MKRLTAIFLTLLLSVLSTGLVHAAGYDDESIQLLAVDKLSTRNGPGTKYRETGTFDLRGKYVTVLTCEEDEGGTCWVECEFPWRGCERNFLRSPLVL